MSWNDILKTVSVPTLDQPFGIDLWAVFTKLYTPVMGVSPTDFKFVDGVTLMSTLKETLIALSAYYVIIFGGREIMRNRPAFVLNGPFMIHNLYLTIISGGLLALFIEQLLGPIWRNGVFFGICSHEGGWTKELVTLYYVSIFTSSLKVQ